MQYSDSKINPEYKQLSELPLNRFDYNGMIFNDGGYIGV